MQFQFKKEWVIPTSVGFSSFGIGMVTGYAIGLHRNKNIAQKIEEVKIDKEEFESGMVQLQFALEESRESASNAVQQVAHIARRLKQYEPEELTLSVEEHPSNKKDNSMVIELSPEEDDSDRVNIFVEEEEDDWDYEIEERNRSPEHPYIIHRDEFFENEGNYGQSTISYYVGDNVLCDEHDVPIYNPEKLVGILEFGKGSRDPNVVYVRNDRLEADYEVLREPGYFQTDVLGVQIEDTLNADDLKHSIYKFRVE